MAPPIVSSPVLTSGEIEHFLAHGFIRLTNCFDTSPGSVAERWVAESWQRNGISAGDFSSWPKDKIHMSATESIPVREFSPRAFAAICELCGGEDRLANEPTWGNSFIANYGFGRDQAWLPPAPSTPGWHVDGDFFLHFLDSAEQGLLLVVLFSDLHHQGGGTYVAADSIAPVARHLVANPKGCNPFRMPYAKMIATCTDCRELTGRAGDVFLTHPFMLHASSYNHRPEARLMINPCVSLREPMRLDRRSDGSAYSPVERAILTALNIDHYAFRPKGPRLKIDAKAARAGFIAEERAHDARRDRRREILLKLKGKIARLFRWWRKSR